MVLKSIRVFGIGFAARAVSRLKHGRWEAGDERWKTKDKRRERSDWRWNMGDGRWGINDSSAA